MLSNNPTAPCYMVAYCPHIATLGWCMLLHLGVCIGPDNVGHGENADETLSFSTGDDRQQTDFMSTHLLHHPFECVIRMHGNQMPGGGRGLYRIYVKSGHGADCPEMWTFSDTYPRTARHVKSMSLYYLSAHPCSDTYSLLYRDTGFYAKRSAYKVLFSSTLQPLTDFHTYSVQRPGNAIILLLAPYYQPSKISGKYPKNHPFIDIWMRLEEKHYF
jgi:hypothetical protein